MRDQREVRQHRSRSLPTLLSNQSCGSIPTSTDFGLSMSSMAIRPSKKALWSLSWTVLLAKKVYKITGTVSASNYLQTPKSPNQSLGLTGRYIYCQFMPIAGQFFSIHIELLSTEGNTVRLTFSNLFKEFRTSSRLIQFPCPNFPSRWTIMVVDAPTILHGYSIHQYRCMKSVQFCSNMLVRNFYTSDTLFDFETLPRDMAFPLNDGKQWGTTFRWVAFPPMTGPNQGESIVHSAKSVEKDVNSSLDVVGSPDLHSAAAASDGGRVGRPVKSTSRASGPRTPSKIQLLTGMELPPDGEKDVLWRKTEPAVKRDVASQCKGPSFSDSMMDIENIVGYSPVPRNMLWCQRLNSLIYSSGHTIIVYNIGTGSQRFLVGHTGGVCAMGLSQDGMILASAQDGRSPFVYLWDVIGGFCTAILTEHNAPVSCISFSYSMPWLLTVSNDSKGRQEIIQYDLSKRSPTGPTVVFRHSTDFHIIRMKFNPYDHNQIVSCGRDNIRLWRRKGDVIHSLPVHLEDFWHAEFYDLDFNAGAHGQTLFVCSSLGSVYQIHLERRLLETIYQLHDAPIFSLSVSDSYCVTGSGDRLLRLWPLDFSDYILEAEHEDSIVSCIMSDDGTKVFVGSSHGTIGCLDTLTQSHETFLRSHRSPVNCVSVDRLRGQAVTVSSDATLRIWDLSNHQQLCEFEVKGSNPRAVTWHPHNYTFSCGFDDGIVRVFDVETTSVLYETKQHQGPVKGLAYTNDGCFLLSAGVDTRIVVYDVSSEYRPIKMLPSICSSNVTTMNLAVSPDGAYVAFQSKDSGSIILLDAQSLTERGILTNHTSSFSAFTFTPDSKDIVAATEDYKIQLYNIGACSLLQEISLAHTSRILSLAIDSTHKILISGGSDQFIRIWPWFGEHLITPEYQRFIGHCGDVTCIAMGPDERHLLSTGRDGKLIVWRLSDTVCMGEFGSREGDSFFVRCPPRILSKVSDTPRVGTLLANGIIDAE
eukprot:TRINITY_DN5458_c0_g1_i4.p1 TRINITY_DN5458_c0_g1~~TRINITY_DN5458_c0_g1_i4.p1  ORF type:complete len:980 (-),score=137.24 TRINITY_DN5458_c0_g1_i4:162-3101(-)